ncbi:LysR family transcriptional regulator [Pseudonocardia dioxanivorans]|uniref:LysR family transcriptional regulator n=1 Tax=Pseudonocardia dioxanivorans TaxID=240495 RepID=UPI0018F87EC4|nr:LysR family transcriptional regulator [Pseudonocardia dioxanivorans]
MPDLRNIDLNLLVSLDALLATRSVTEAARRLNLSQSAMSGSLARLRKLFDDPLLVRNGRTLAATTRAEALAGPVRDILASVSEVLTGPEAFTPATTRRTFSVSASDYATAVLLAPMLRTLSTEAPNITINVRPRSPDVRGLLRDDVVDVAIEPRELMAGTTLPHAVLFQDRWVCVVDAATGRVGGGTLDVAEFLALPHVIYSIGPDMTLNIADRHLADLGLRRRVEVTVESFLLVPALVRGTDLVSLVLERSTRLHSTEGLLLLEPPVPVPGISETMYWNPRRTSDPGHRWLRGKLLAAARELTQDVTTQ